MRATHIFFILFIFFNSISSLYQINTQIRITAKIIAEYESASKVLQHTACWVETWRLDHENVNFKHWTMLWYHLISGTFDDNNTDGTGDNNAVEDVMVIEVKVLHCWTGVGSLRPVGQMQPASEFNPALRPSQSKN